MNGEQPSMDARNPHLPGASRRCPLRKYRVTFLPSGRTVEVDPAETDHADDGLPWSILDVALRNGVEIDHACGGVCACATCHVIVRQGLESCGDPVDEEEDRLDDAYGLTPQSRLACVCVPDGSSDVVVEIPAWNRNRVREGH
jgi:2Fe-2S ferredoxin